MVFLDVGQGDAILILNGSYQMLIDGGRDGRLLLNKLGKYIPFWDRNIETIVATHPDQDHIAGLIDVMEKYNVKAIIENSDQSDTQTFKKFSEDMDLEKANKIEAKNGVKIKFPDGAEAEVIYPIFETGEIIDRESNSGSIVIKLNYGENNFLFTGDLPKEQEKIIVDSGQDIYSGILKIAHHGSKYSTSPEFLEKVNPKDAVISVGKDNSYGHPNREILNLLQEKGINVFRTDEKGDILYKCKKDSFCELNNT